MKKYNPKQGSPFEWEPKDWIPVYGFFSYKNRTKEFKTATEEDVSNRKYNRIYQAAMFTVAATGLLKIIL